MLGRFRPVPVLGRWRDGVEAWRLVRPDEQDTARRVIDDESRRAPEAVGAETRVVAVPRHNEQVGILHRRDGFAFGTTTTAFSDDIATKPSRRSGKDLGLGQACRGLDGVSWVRPVTASPEQACVSAVEALGHRRVDHVEQDDLSIERRDLCHGVDTGRPGAIGEPRDDLHDTPEIRRIAQSAATPPTREAGTVSNPKRVKSPMAGRTSWA